jgi:DNA polymerase III subunit alpha, Gram-positive type
MKKEQYIVLDIETTGLSKYNHKITEIAAIKVANKKIIQEFQTLINPQVRIPNFITSLTGISNSMVKDSPIIEEVMPQFLKFLGNNPFVAHCATFDQGFLDYNARIYFSQELLNPKICTRKLSRRLIPSLSSYKLSSLCEYFQLRNFSAHRAMGDVQVTNLVFDKLLDLMKMQGIERKNEILQFQDSKIPRSV